MQKLALLALLLAPLSATAQPAALQVVSAHAITGADFVRPVVLQIKIQNVSKEPATAIMTVRMQPQAVDKPDTVKQPDYTLPGLFDPYELTEGIQKLASGASKTFVIRMPYHASSQYDVSGGYFDAVNPSASGSSGDLRVLYKITFGE